MCVCNLDQYGKIETITHIIIIFTFVSTYTFIVLFFCFWFIYATLITKTYVSGLYCLTWVDYYITIIHLGYTPHHMDLILYVCLRVFICGNWRGNGSGSGSGSGYLSGYIFRYAVIIIYRVIGSNVCTRKEGGILQNYTHTHTQRKHPTAPSTHTPIIPTIVTTIQLSFQPPSLSSSYYQLYLREWKK